VEPRDNGTPAPIESEGLSSLSENSENSPRGEEEESYALLLELLEHYARWSEDRVKPGSQPDLHLLEIARMLPLGRVKALRRHMDGVWSQSGVRVRVPSGARELRRVADAYLPRQAAAL
jgi:hypothetical protein